MSLKKVFGTSKQACGEKGRLTFEGFGFGVEKNLLGVSNVAVL